MNEVIRGYQDALRRSLPRLADVRGNSVLVEATVGTHSDFAGTTVATAPWPLGTFALSIHRHSHLLVPRPETLLQPGDVVAAVAPAAADSDLRLRLAGTLTPS